MPIAGLTNVPKAFLKLGQIRKGEKDPQTGAPRDLDYFRVTFHESERECAELFREVYGEQPRAINIRLAFPNIDDVWDANYECYAKGGMIAKASSVQDPVTLQEKIKWIFYRDHQTGQVLVRNGFPVGDEGIDFIEQPIDLTKPVYSYKNRKGETVDVLLEPVGRLNVVVPELAHIRVGYLEFRPGSPKDISAISRELAGIDHMAHQAGKDITGIPMRLTRREEEISKNINGKLSRGPSWLVHIEVSGEWGGKALEYIERKALPEFIDAEAVDIGEVEPEEWPEYVQEDEAPIKQESVAVSRNPDNSVNPPGRPYDPETLKKGIANKVQYHIKQQTTASINDRKVLASILDTTFGGEKTKRYELCKWLVGQSSTQKMKQADVLALLDWLGVREFNAMPADYVIKEINSAHTAALLASGQQELI